MAPPSYHRLFKGIIMGKIILRYPDIKTFGNIPVIFRLEGQRIIF